MSISLLVVAHSGRLGLVDEHSRAAHHPAGEIILLDPRRKHGLVPVGRTAEEQPYDRTHGPVHDEALQFLFLDFDVRRPDLRARFRGRLRTNSQEIHRINRISQD